MKILVTGTAGFIGYHLTKRLIGRGDTVVGIDNINDLGDTNLKFARLAETGITTEAEKWYKKTESGKYPNYSFIRMNLEDTEQLEKLFKEEKFDKVCNLAAQAGVRYSLQNPHVYISSNITGFMNILESCRHHNIRHLVYASSSSVYGNNAKMPLSTGDNVDHPVSLYAATKKSNELMAHTYSHLFGLPTTGLRFFTVYGPWGRPDMAPFLFTKAILKGQPIKVFNHGNLQRDFTYVDDIVEGIIRVIDQSAKPVAGKNPGISESATAPYKIYNIGNSAPVKLMDFISAIEKALNKKAKKEFLPMQPGDVYSTQADVSDLINEMGYKPDTQLEKGIEKFIEWYKEFYDECKFVNS